MELEKHQIVVPFCCAGEGGVPLAMVKMAKPAGERFTDTERSLLLACRCVSEGHHSNGHFQEVVQGTFIIVHCTGITHPLLYFPLHVFSLFYLSPILPLHAPSLPPVNTLWWM